MQLVIKIGGAAGVGGTALFDDLAQAFRDEPESLLIHGGSDETTRLQAALGQPARFLESPSGQTSRQTDRKDLEAFAMATGGINRKIVEALRMRGLPAFGCSGLDGGMVEGPRKSVVRAVLGGASGGSPQARRKTVLIRDQWTGRPERVDTQAIAALQGCGYLPVLAPIIGSPSGEMLNTDGDRLAAAVAGACNAGQLIILTNVPGLLEDPQCEDSLIEHLTHSQLLERRDCAQGRMRKKLLGASEALRAGVPRVVIADARLEQPIAQALAGRGTVIVQDPSSAAGGPASVELREETPPNKTGRNQQPTELNPQAQGTLQ